jgi:hypothetical protein
MGGKRLGSSRLLLGVAVVAVVGLVCVVLFLPWSVSAGCHGWFGYCPPDANSALNLFKVASIVVLGLIALTALALGLNSDLG